jgi:hypothetical protein
MSRNIQDWVEIAHGIQTESKLFINIYTKEKCFEYIGDNILSIMKLQDVDEFTHEFKNYMSKSSSIYGYTFVVFLQDLCSILKDLEYLSKLIVIIDETKSEPTYVMYPKYKSGDTGIITRCFESLV